MATRKHEVVIHKGAGAWLDIFADPGFASVIEGVGGVMKVHAIPESPYIAFVDPRYDTDEVAASIKNAIKGALLLEQWTQQEPESEQEVPDD